MSEWIFLSHPLDESTPVYGDGEGFRSESIKSISRGDSCNTARWTIPNHLNTHVDLPRHFTKEGRTLSDYRPGFWILNNVCLVDISPVSPGEHITSENLTFNSIPTNTELLLIKTGFQKTRGTLVYAKNGPVFDPEIAEELRKRCPSVRIVGFDAISLSSFENRELGRIAHSAFLNNESPIIVLEDIDLQMVDHNTKFEMVVVSPLHVKNADGSPCTILAEIS